MMKNKSLKVLSVHTSNKCSVNCPFCYLDKSDIVNEKPHQWWVAFFNQLDNIEQVAIAWNDQPLGDICEYVKIASAKEIIVNITCHPRMITSKRVVGLKEAGITMISLSVDRYKCKNIADVELPLKILKNYNVKSGVNLLMDDDIVINLEKVVEQLLNFGADMVYALQPKPNTLTIGEEKLKSQLLLSTFLFRQKFAVDEASQLIIGKSESCKRGKDLLSVNSKGELCLCSFDKGFKLFNGIIEPLDIETPECPFI